MSTAELLRVGVVGAGGRMGAEVCRAVAAAPDLDLVAAVDPGYAGETVSGLEVSGELGALAQAGAQVAVDFTVADVARTTLQWCAQHGVHAVVGTSGLTEEDLADAGRRCAASGANAVVAANFAVGAVLVMRFSELAAPFFGGAEIVELHHDAKLDAPSGTAMATARRMAESRSRAGMAPYPGDATSLAVLAGARGGDGPGGVRIHSVRLPGLVAHQEVLLGAEGQSLTLRHDSYDRRSFMPGVLLAVRAVPDRPGLTVGLEPLLGI